MRRLLLLLSVVLVVLLVAPAASARKPVREINPSQGEAVIVGQCAFPVLARIDGPEILTTFFDNAGDPVRQIGVFPGNTLILTNMETDARVTVMGTGLFSLRVASDGSGSVQVTGHGPFIPHPVTGEPGIWYLSGRGRATFDADGEQTSARITGRLVDLCARLAS
jgi:hypothetical protein